MPDQVIYRCAECGGHVVVLDDGAITRECAHQTSAVTADISGHAVGVGGLLEE